MKKILTAAVLLLSLPLAAQKPVQLAQPMAEAGMVRISETDPSIAIDLHLASTANCTRRALYADAHEAYLHPQAAVALKKAQAALKRLRPDLSLMVLDAARPMSVQGLLYAAVAGTDNNIYISDPRSGGDQHNYGLAVDVTLCNEQGDTLTMGTAIGDFVPESGIAAEERTGDGEGTLTAEAVENRKLLRRVMAAGGFKPLRTEWWHFNFRTRSEAKANFKVIR